MKSIFFILATFFSYLSLAQRLGHDQGNGGNVVVCDQKVELLDHYEARVLRGIKLDLGPAETPYMEKVRGVLHRLEHLNFHRAQLYLQWANDFSNEAYWTSDELISLPDNGPGSIPPGCELKQIAIQQNPTLPGDYRYVIKKSLWDQLNNNGKAGLVLHELILRELVNQSYLPHSNSKNARYFNAIISSKSFTMMNLKQYLELLILLNFENADAQQGTEIGLFLCDRFCEKWLPTFWNDNVVEYARPKLLPYPQETANVFFSGSFLPIRKSDISFSSDGQLSGFYTLQIVKPTTFFAGPVEVTIVWGVGLRQENGVASIRGQTKITWHDKNYNCEILKLVWSKKEFLCENWGKPTEVGRW